LGALRVKSDLFDLLISSADVKVSKASGGIFALVEERMGAKPEDFVHVGDGFKGDFKKPKEHGWQALHLPLATTDIVARRVDHLKTAAMLNASYGLSIDVAMPN
jgi:FMN phosphatase YigB (HAD superfamily)